MRSIEWCSTQGNFIAANAAGDTVAPGPGRVRQNLQRVFRGRKLQAARLEDLDRCAGSVQRQPAGGTHGPRLLRQPALRMKRRRSPSQRREGSCIRAASLPVRQYKIPLHVVCGPQAPGLEGYGPFSENGRPTVRRRSRPDRESKRGITPGFPMESSPGCGIRWASLAERPSRFSSSHGVIGGFGIDLGNQRHGVRWIPPPITLDGAGASSG